MTEITNIVQYINIAIIPIAIWIIRLEKRLTRIETILEIKLHKREDRRKC